MKKVSLLLLTLIIAVSFLGCKSVSIQDVPQIRTGVDSFISSTITDDADAAYEALHQDIKRSEFNNAYLQIAACMDGVESYELTPIRYNVTNRNGTKIIQLTYDMQTNCGNFLVNAAIIEGNDGLIAFNVAPQEQTALTYSGTLGHMQGANLLQWFVLILGLITWVFVILVFVDCCRTKIKRKILWLILIALGCLILSLSMTNGMLNLRFNIGLYLMISFLMLYGNGSWQFSLLIPIGAILYLCMKKELMAKALGQKENVEDSLEPSTAEEILTEKSEIDAIEE